MHTLRLLSLLVSAAVSLGMQAKSKAADVARFDLFTYSGDDDYYRQNPLADDAQFYNPVIPGWASDPSLCRVGEDYFLVTSTFTYFPGVPLYHSTDLVNWQLVGNVLNRPSQLSHLQGQRMNDGGIYAPTIRFNPHNKTYYMVTTDVGWANFYVTTKDPFGAWSDPIELPEVGGIDPSFFFDDDGKAYIVHKEDVAGQPKWNNHRAIRIIRFDTETGKTFGPDVPLNEEGVGDNERLDRDEGPHLYKINGKYYLTCAEGGTGNFHSEVVYRADSVFGPYVRWSRNPMLTQRGLKAHRSNPTTCTGHTDLVQAPDGSWQAVFLGCRAYEGKAAPLGRETFMMPVRWSKDGFPFLTQSIDTVPYVLSLPGATLKAGARNGNFSLRDDFSGKTLSCEWISPAGSPAAFCRLKNGLQLSCSDTRIEDLRPCAYLGRRLQHLRYEVSTRVDFTPESPNAKAGLLLLRNEQHQYFLCKEQNAVSLYRIGKRWDKIATAKYGESSVELRALCLGTTINFYYRETSKKGDFIGEWTLISEGNDAAFLSTGGGFIGATAGVYAVK